MYINYYFCVILLIIYVSLCVGKTPNDEYALKNETNYVMNKNPGLDENASAPAVNITEKPRLPCKEEKLGVITPWSSMDNATLNHYGMVKRNSTGHRTSFEIHFSVKTDGYLHIGVSESNGGSMVIICDIIVGYWFNHTSLSCSNGILQSIETLDINSSTEFRSFYMKIDDGKLQFGKEGENPLISGSDATLGSLNYYFFYVPNGSGTIRYCPAAVEGNNIISE